MKMSSFNNATNGEEELDDEKLAQFIERANRKRLQYQSQILKDKEKKTGELFKITNDFSINESQLSELVGIEKASVAFSSAAIIIDQYEQSQSLEQDLES